MVALLGANGAGKTSLLEAISGVVPSSGRVLLDGEPIDQLSPGARARRGLSHVEQGRTIFADMTVEQNLMVVADKADRDAGLGEFPELNGIRNQRAGLLSGGQQQMLVIARALAQRPRYLLLDELSLGLAPVVVKRLLPRVREFARRGMGVVLVEQFAFLALDHVDRAVVLRRGAVAMSGTAAEVRQASAHLADAYLGAPSMARDDEVGAP